MDSARDDLNATQSSNAGSQLGKTVDIRRDGQIDYFRGGSNLSKTQKATANRLKSSRDEQLDVVIESFSTKGKRVQPRTRASFINKNIEKKQRLAAEEAHRRSVGNDEAILEEPETREKKTHDVGC